MPDNLIDQSTFTEPVQSASPGGDAGQWGTITKAALQAVANRTRWLKDLVETLTGSSGSIGNITDVDTSGQSEGYVLRLSSGVWAATPLSETGMRAYQDGSEYQPSILSDAQASHDTLGEFQNVVNSALSISDPLGGSNPALRMDSVSTGDMRARLVNDIAVTALSTYRATVRSRTASASRATRVGLEYLDGASASLGITYSAAVTNSSGAWVDLSIEATAPAGTATARLVYEVQATGVGGEVHYWDDSTLQLKLVPRNHLDFLSATLTDDPTNDAIRIGAVSSAYKRITASYVPQRSDNQAIIEVDASGGNITIALPDGFDAGYRVRFQRIDSSANTVTFTATSLTGAITQLVGQWTGASVYSVGGDAWVAVPFSGSRIGEVVVQASAPVGGTWLPCDHTVVLQSAYSALFGQLGLITDLVDIQLSESSVLHGGDDGTNYASNVFNLITYEGVPSYWASYQSDSSVANNAWIGADFGSNKFIEWVEWIGLSNNRTPHSVDFEVASNSNFSTILASVAAAEPIELRRGIGVRVRMKPVEGRYARVIARAEVPSNPWHIWRLRFFGRDYSYNTATHFVTPRIASTQNVWIKAAG